jgi:addiction module HigA family antidote
MTRIPAASPDGLDPVHPGAILADIIDAMPQGKAEIARALGISRPALYNILDGSNAVTASMALRLGKLFGNEPQFWLNLQATHDLKVARGAMAEDLAAITPFPASGA